MADNQQRKYEDELADLESIVTQIDSGELSLEDSIAAFERGIALVRSLNQKLDEVERRVEVLIRDSRGELKRTPYQGDDLPRDNNGSDESNAVDKDDDVPF
jgi:exodeoxyribonuclease VII small subunit